MDVHHVNYRDIYDVMLPDLLVLCRGCHEAKHPNPSRPTKPTPKPKPAKAPKKKPVKPPKKKRKKYGRKHRKNSKKWKPDKIKVSKPKPVSAESLAEMSVIRAMQDELQRRIPPRLPRPPRHPPQ